MSSKASAKSLRAGISLIELVAIFADEQTAIQWFESIYWNGKRRCEHCRSTNNKEVPYWCTRIPLRKRAFVAYL